MIQAIVPELIHYPQHLPALTPEAGRIPCLRSYREQARIVRISSTLSRDTTKLSAGTGYTTEVVMELCCALHTFWVRMTPWQPIV